MRAAMTILLATAALAVSPARAADDVAEARAHLKKGAQLYRAGKYRESIVEFEAAYRAKPAGAIHFNVAQARERLGDHAEALRSYRDYLREVPNANDVAAVRATIRALEEKLAAAGVQALIVESDPPGADVTIDGARRGRTPLAIALPAGAHRVALAREGLAGVEREVVLAADAAAEMQVVLGPETAAAAAPRSHPDLRPPPPDGILPPDAPRKPPSPGPRPRVYSWIAAGASALALGAAAYYGIDAARRRDQLRDGTQRTTAQADALVAAQRSSVRRANALGAAGGGLAAASGVLFVVEGRF